MCDEQTPPPASPHSITLDANTNDGSDIGTITKVELRVYGHEFSNLFSAHIVPVFGGSTDGIQTYSFTDDNLNESWSQYFDITSDDSAPGTWSWSDVQDLDARLEITYSPNVTAGNVYYVSKVEIRVTFT